jgi:ribulose-phosphate 3-epimerase
VVADRITFHVEATRYPWRVITLVRRAGVRMVGVALNPATPIDAIEGMPDGVSLVNILSTEPDVDGERFLAPTLARIRAIRSRRGPATTVVVDGGVTETTIRSVVDAGASEIVVGRALIGADDPAAALERLRRLCR